MKQLIADLKTRLATVAAIRYIDEDWGQLDYYSPNQPVKWPCVIIDINQAAWGNQGEHVQIGLAQISIRVADMKLSNTNAKAPSSQQTAAASIFDLLTSIHAALHGWTADSASGPLTRTLTRKVNRDDGIREFEMIYSVQLFDDSAKIVYDTVPITGDKVRFHVRLNNSSQEGIVYPPPPEPDPEPDPETEPDPVT